MSGSTPFKSDAEREYEAREEAKRAEKKAREEREEYLRLHTLRSGTGFYKSKDEARAANEKAESYRSQNDSCCVM